MAILFLSFLMVSCYYDKEDELYPVDGGTCDVTDVKYSSDIKPVITTHCLNCHSNTSASGLGQGIKLENYADIQKYANDGSLYGSVAADPEYYVMPRDSRISPCSVQKIKAWIDNGAPNN